MIEDVRLSRGLWVTIGILIGVILFGLPYVSWGQCTPVTWGEIPFSGGSLFKPIYGASPADYVPLDMIVYKKVGNYYTQGGQPPNKGSYNYWRVGAMVGHNVGTVPGGFCWVPSNGTGPSQCGTGTGWDRRILIQCGHDGGGSFEVYPATLYTLTASTKNHDCDGLMDNVDPYAWPYVDTDQDGIIDSKDPFPTNANCPGSGANWQMVRWYTKRSGVDQGCTTQFYKDVTGACGEWYSTSCANNYSDFGLDDWRMGVSVNYGSGGKTYDQLNIGTQSVNSGTSGSSGSVGSGTENTGTSTGAGTGGASSTADYNNASGDNKIITDYLAGIQRNTKDVASNTSGLIDTLEKVRRDLTALAQQAAKPADVTVDMTGVEGRLDTVNTKLGNIETTIQNIGDINTLPDGDGSAMQDNSDLSEEATAAIQAGEEALLHGWFDNFWENNNIVKNLVEGSRVEVENSCSSLSVNAGQFSFTLQFAGFESQLGLMGYFFVALCGMTGFIDFMRG